MTRIESASEWWGARRVRYNLALAGAGLLAFVLYASLVWSNPGKLPDAEITLFTIIFQAFGYLLVIAVANVCYFIGPISERIVKPANLLRYRKTTYALGFWFSVALPFAVPALVLVVVIRTPDS